MDQGVVILAHLGVHHKTVFEAVTHVLSQWIMIIVISAIVAGSVVWWLNRRNKQERDE